MSYAALITAGGIGKRMGANGPKQYLNLLGEPILGRTVMVFELLPLIDVIVVTVPPGDESRCRSLLTDRLGARKVRAVVSGGATRQASVYEGLLRLKDTEIIAVHDGVRPLVSPEVITATLEAARDVGAAVACSPVRDTVKRRFGERLETIPRSDLWLAHTPQTFKTPLILEAHERARTDGADMTDDCALVERLNAPVAIVEDSDENLKITTPADLETARMILERRERSSPKA